MALLAANITVIAIAFSISVSSITCSLFCVLFILTVHRIDIEHLRSPSL
jgi:hypothetical protein